MGSSGGRLAAAAGLVVFGRERSVSRPTSFLVFTAERVRLAAMC